MQSGAGKEKSLPFGVREIVPPAQSETAGGSFKRTGLGWVCQYNAGLTDRPRPTTTKNFRLRVKFLSLRRPLP